MLYGFCAVGAVAVPALVVGCGAVCVHTSFPLVTIFDMEQANHLSCRHSRLASPMRPAPLPRCHHWRSAYHRGVPATELESISRNERGAEKRVYAATFSSPYFLLSTHR